MDYGEVAVYDGRDGNVIWEGTVEVPATAYRYEWQSWPDGVSAAEVFDQLEAEDDPYADVPPPAETDGPAESVDWSELDEEQHPSVPDGDE